MYKIRNKIINFQIVNKIPLINPNISMFKNKNIILQQINANNKIFLNQLVFQEFKINFINQIII